MNRLSPRHVEPQAPPLYAVGQRVRVTTGSQRNATGVIDKAHDWPTGTSYRVTDPEQHAIVGWFTADQLEIAERTPQPGPLTEREQLGLRLLMGESS